MHRQSTREMALQRNQSHLWTAIPPPTSRYRDLHGVKKLVAHYILYVQLVLLFKTYKVFSSPSRAFPIIGGRRNDFGFIFFHFVLSNMSSPFTPTLSISLLLKSFHLVFRLPLHLMLLNVLLMCKN